MEMLPGSNTTIGESADANAAGEAVFVYPLVFDRARLGIGRRGDSGMRDVWDYDSAEAAMVAAMIWDGEGEPDAWVRHPKTGRRRPGGDPALEYVLS